ncbi:S-adenosyl-L-methionine-dependent methyltransferase [Cadophora sp. DSE1049]|nr:S-adenosyl-L-methionine-dependent methyltransferase [Cadophora sp. DSE1049]
MHRSTISVNPLVYDFVQENDHTYNRYKEGKYLLPNDEDEKKRQDMQHDLFLVTLKGDLHLAPLKDQIHHALDIATGTGIWATEFAQKYPTTNVIGTDLSPIQNEYIPRNCKFEIDDIGGGWTYRNPFDYIHGRQLHTCSGDFRSVVQKAFTALIPGGYIELQDSLPITCIDDSWNDTAIQRWAGKMAEGAKKLGVDWTKTSKYQQWMEDTGFEDIKEVELVWPTNYWPKDRFQKGLGQLANEVLKQGLHGYSIKILTDAYGMNATEISFLLEEVEKDLNNTSIHCCVPIRVIYGRKPE